MNEVKTTGIETLTTEILILKQQTAQNIIEIGKRLISVKESLPHGNFGDYLKEKVAFSERTAQNFMKAAREFSNTQALADMEPTKVYALLELPSEERENFISASHEVNGEIKKVDEMTTRELQKVIKEKQDLEEKLKDSMEFNKKAHGLASLREQERDEAQKNVKNLQDALRKQKEKSEKDIADLQTFIGEAQVSGNDEEVARLQASLQELQNDVDSSAQKIDELEAQLKAKPIDVITAEPVIIEKVPEEVERELQELRKKNNQNNDQSVIKFKRQYNELQNIFKAQLELIDEMEDSNSENYEKFKKATLNLIEEMSKRLQ